MMKLYGFWRSTATWRVRIVLAHKGLPYEYVPIHLTRGGGEQHGPEFRRVNPMPHVPVLELPVDGTTRLVSESLAIIELLEEQFPEPAILPRDAFQRARARQLASLIASGIQPLQNNAVQRCVREELHADERAWVRHWVERGLGPWETLVRETAGTFAVGDALSVADVCLAPQVAFCQRFDVDLSPYPTLLGIADRCAALPAFQAAHADKQVDAEPT